MKSKRRSILIIINILLTVVCAASIYFFRDWLLVRPSQLFPLSEVVGACQDQDGNLYVIDSAGERLLKASPDGELQWQLKASESDFDKAVRICTDESGYLYVQNVCVKSGIRLKEESILQYSPDGTLLQELCKREAAKDQIRPTIVGLFGTGSEAASAIVSHDGISIRTLPDSVLHFFPLADIDARDFVLNAVWDSQSDTLWYCTFNGRIFRYVDGGKDELLYDNSQHVQEFESVPRSISFLNGTLYAADRGLRCLDAIDTASGEVSFLHEDLPWAEREVFDSVNSDCAVAATTGSYVKFLDGEQLVDIDAFTLSPKLRTITILLWVCLVILALILCTDLILLGFILLHKASSMTRIVTAVLASVGLLSAMLIGTLFPNFRDQFYRTMFDKAEFCASLTVERMPLNSFLNLDESSDYLGTDYLKVQDAVNSVFKTGSESVDNLYCTMYRVLGDHDTITIVYSMDENSMLLPYDWEYEESDEQSILISGIGKQYVNRSVEGSYLFVLNPILDEEGHAVGLIEVGTDLQSFNREMTRVLIDLLLNLVALTAVGVMCLIEIIYFIRGHREYRSPNRDHAAGSVEEGMVIPAGVLRMVVFLVFFFTNLTTAILPTYAIHLAHDVKVPGISSAVIAAIPFSAEVVSGALFSVLGAKLIRKLSLKRAALLCAVLFTAGLALRIVPNFWMITLGSLVIGAGWGVILLIVNVLIAQMPGDSKDVGFAYYNAAALNGINSGTVFGGFLLNWIPGIALFALTAIGSFCLFGMVWRYLIHADSANLEEEEDSADEGRMSFLKFLLSPNILIFFLMLVVPVLIGSYFLIYMYPIIGTRWGLSETYVGYSFLLNGLCVIAMSTIMTNLFTRLRKKRFGLTLSALLYAAAFSLVAALHSIPALLVALVILGFSDSFGLPLQTSFYTDQKEVERFGVDRSLGVYSLFENVSQSLGPFVFSWALVIGTSRGLYIIAGVISVLAVVFLLAGLFFRRKTA